MDVSAHFDEREYGEQTVYLLPPLRVSFDRVWRWLEKALAVYGPTHRKSDVWALIAKGEARLWTAEKCAIITMTDVWPTGFKEMSFWLCGGDLDAVMELRPRIEAWAKENGCDRVMFMGREGWRKPLPDYRRGPSMFVKELV